MADRLSFEEKLANLRTILNKMDWEPDGTNVKQGYRYLTHTKIKGNVSKALSDAGLEWAIEYSEPKKMDAVGQMTQHFIVEAVCTIYDVGGTGKSKSYTVWGESADSGDKALSKVQTNAFKNFWANNFMLSLYTPEEEAVIDIKDSVKAEGGSEYKAKKEVAKEKVLKENPAKPEVSEVKEETKDEKKPLSETQKKAMSRIMEKATTMSESELASIGISLVDVGADYNNALGKDDGILGADFIQKYKKVMG